MTPTQPLSVFRLTTQGRNSSCSSGDGIHTKESQCCRIRVGYKRRKGSKQWSLAAIFLVMKSRISKIEAQRQTSKWIKVGNEKYRPT